MSQNKKLCQCDWQRLCLDWDQCCLADSPSASPLSSICFSKISPFLISLFVSLVTCVLFCLFQRFWKCFRILMSLKKWSMLSKYSTFVTYHSSRLTIARFEDDVQRNITVQNLGKWFNMEYLHRGVVLLSLSNQKQIQLTIWWWDEHACLS